jgi:alkanesulfonate monooxygenase SsuD/methylene tetrahydromethanopterin reductase-like flavin-dependent oxidoreductase (luciferase family)
MKKYGRDPRSIPVFDSRDFWVSEDAEQGWEDVREHIFYSYSKYAEWGAAAADADGVPVDKRHEPATTPEEMRSISDLSGPFVGNPEQAVDFYRRRQAEVPINGTILRIPPGIAHEKIVKYLELLAAEVLPKLADD